MLRKNEILFKKFSREEKEEDFPHLDYLMLLLVWLFSLVSRKMLEYRPVFLTRYTISKSVREEAIDTRNKINNKIFFCWGYFKIGEKRKNLNSRKKNDLSPKELKYCRVVYLIFLCHYFHFCGVKEVKCGLSLSRKILLHGRKIMNFPGIFHKNGKSFCFKEKFVTNKTKLLSSFSLNIHRPVTGDMLVTQLSGAGRGRRGVLSSALS